MPSKAAFPRCRAGQTRHLPPPHEPSCGEGQSQRGAASCPARRSARRPETPWPRAACSLAGLPPRPQAASREGIRPCQALKRGPESRAAEAARRSLRGARIPWDRRLRCRAKHPRCAGAAPARKTPEAQAPLPSEKPQERRRRAENPRSAGPARKTSGGRIPFPAPPRPRAPPAGSRFRLKGPTQRPAAGHGPGPEDSLQPLCATTPSR
jgi:hypothetical protein